VLAAGTVILAKPSLGPCRSLVPFWCPNAWDESGRSETAFHDAGHAVASIALGVPFRYVTIRPRAEHVAGQGVYGETGRTEERAAQPLHGHSVRQPS